MLAPTVGGMSQEKEKNMEQMTELERMEAEMEEARHGWAKSEGRYMEFENNHPCDGAMIRAIIRFTLEHMENTPFRFSRSLSTTAEWLRAAADVIEKADDELSDTKAEKFSRAALLDRLNDYEEILSGRRKRSMDAIKDMLASWELAEKIAPLPEIRSMEDEPK